MACYEIAHQRIVSLPQSNQKQASHPLNSNDFHTIAETMGGFRVLRKIGFVAAIVATKAIKVITYRKGKETENIAQPGDYITTNLLPETRQPLLNNAEQPDQYVIKVDKFTELYEPFGEICDGFGPVYKAKGVVKAIFFENGFAIVPPWGGSQLAESGYLFLNGDEVYGCEREACEATYEEE